MKQIEKVHLIGKDAGIVGIVTEPDNINKKESSVAVIFLNAGLLHHVGPHRLHVDAARQIAGVGYRAMRFDISGLGDSKPRFGESSYEEISIQDIRETMDFVSSKFGNSRFILIGLCSGADNAHAVANVDSRVTGIVALDWYASRTRHFYMLHLKRRFFECFRLKKWVSLIKGKYKSLVSQDSRQSIFVREFPPKQVIEKGLAKMVKRGIKLKYVYSGDFLGYFNYEGQFEDMFDKIDFQGQINVELKKDTDHTYTSVRKRERLITEICSWIQENFG